MPRFVLLLHRPGPQLSRSDAPHFDWMFESGATLKTFATKPFNAITKESPDTQFDCEAHPLSDHRLAYLQWQGEISGGRGDVRRLIAGEFHPLQVDDDRFHVALCWTEGETSRDATADFYRKRTSDLRRIETRDEWRLRFSS